MYYHHVKNYQKSLRYIIKYFQAYLYSPNFATQCYLEEVQILQCFNLNFKELNGSSLVNGSAHALSNFSLVYSD